jgi:ubiquinone/menaquinone biosynthesis C-methylase UbiE
MLATDVSPEMIRIASEKLAAQSVPQLRFAVSDAPSLLTADPVYDAVLAFNVLHLLPALEPTLRAMHAAMRPGGLAISKTPCLAEMNPLIPRLAVPLARAVGLAPPVRSLDAATLRYAFQRSGFVVEAMERHGTKRKDWRVFIVARKSGGTP